MPDQPLTLAIHRAAAHIPIGAGVLASLRVEQVNDLVAGDAVRILADLLAEKLPPEHMEDTVSFTVPRFATWFDHFCATYRGTLWGWMLGLDKHEIRYHDEPWTHRTTVSVRGRWTYPRAKRIAPAHEFGMAVYRAETSSEARAWPA